ncbi:MAG: hypothetical protein C5B51_25185 [Terriglobia bacterium]|nr:MAG: hypothetical protein C5B51_25185 [Terriglobia bacterium]
MAYIFKGRLCGYICPDCPEPLANVKVRLYRSRANEGVTLLAAASAKDTFAILSDSDVAAKASSLIAETTAAADGSFTFELGEQQKYKGEAFEIDVYCGTVPHRKQTPKPPKPLQFSITTLQPAWRNTDAGLIAAFDYCVPSRYWCEIRRRFGAWTICGTVVDCKSGAPIAGVKVRAFDVDWLQDDDLGSGVTDGTGKFRIDYLPIDFEQTPLSPLLNFELIGGPDVYFKVETLGGVSLLNESRSQGRTAGRENIGPCFCVKLCVEGGGGDGGNPIPLFTHIGQYHVDPIYGDFTADGLTTAGNYAFTDTIPLIGLLPNGSAPDALEYHFQWGEYNPAGTVLGPVSDLDSTKIAATVIGQLEYFDWDNVNSVWVLRSADYWANNPGVAATIIHRNGMPDISVQLNQTVKPGGWIEVPRQNNLATNGIGLYVGGFVDMVNLDTTKLTSEQYDLTTPAPPLAAGDPMPAGKKSRMHRFKLFFEARKVGTVPILSSNAREKIVMSNTHYIQLHHPNWAGYTNNERCVVLIDAAELAVPGGGCGKITDHVHALFTAYHPFLGSVQVYLEGPTPPPLPPAVNPAISADGESDSPGGGQDFNLTANKDCAYILWIQLTLNLTYGYGAFLSPFYDHVAFCKGS